MKKTTSNTRLAPPTQNQRGRPPADASPPVPVQVAEIPQPSVQGIANPPCCGTAMVPRYRKAISPDRWKVQCSCCGRWLSVSYLGGIPRTARVL